MTARLLVCAALALAPCAPAAAQSTPAFSGRYRLVLTPDPGCPAPMQVGPQTVLVDLSEAAVGTGSEVSGQSASAAEKAEDFRFVLFRSADRLRGPFGAKDEPFLGWRTAEGYRVWMRIMASGVASTSGGRARAEGTAFGELDLARPADADIDSVGACVFALGHRWALEPI